MYKSFYQTLQDSDLKVKTGSKNQWGYNNSNLSRISTIPPTG